MRLRRLRTLLCSVTALGLIAAPSAFAQDDEPRNCWGELYPIVERLCTEDPDPYMPQGERGWWYFNGYDYAGTTEYDPGSNWGKDGPDTGEAKDFEPGFEDGEPVVEPKPDSEPGEAEVDTVSAEDYVEGEGWEITVESEGTDTPTPSTGGGGGTDEECEEEDVPVKADGPADLDGSGEGCA